MSKKRNPDTQTFLFAVKIVGSVALAFLIALGIDISHMSKVFTTYYDQSV